MPSPQKVVAVAYERFQQLKGFDWEKSGVFDSGHLQQVVVREGSTVFGWYSDWFISLFTIKYCRDWPE